MFGPIRLAKHVASLGGVRPCIANRPLQQLMLHEVLAQPGGSIASRSFNEPLIRRVTADYRLLTLRVGSISRAVFKGGPGMPNRRQSQRILSKQ